MANGQVH